jgi:cysteine-rich repeat protein
MNPYAKRFPQAALASIMLAAVSSAAVPASAQSAAIKASIKCRNAIGQIGAGLVKTGFKVLDTCHGNRDKGKFTGDCNDLGAADVKSALAKAEAKSVTTLGKKCLAGDVVRANYPNGDVADALSDAMREEVEASGGAVQGLPSLAGDKAGTKCHKAIGKARTGIVAEIIKLSTKCQKTADKTAATFEELLGTCLALPVKSGPKAATAITKACGVLTGADVGSCTPLPACVVDAATATGQSLASALYGTPPECGNDVVEVGETCDDGNVTDGDGCDSNCTATGCGNGVVTAGEECDDGNALDTDACAQCQDAVCGDGFVRAGVELCGDSVSDASTNPGDATCPVGECTPSGTTRSFEVHFTPPPGVVLSGIRVLVDYPESSVRIPGFSNEASVKGRLTNLPAGLSEPNDRDYALALSVASSDVLAAGRLASLTFDDCTGAPVPTLDQFACAVVDASDTDFNPVNGVVCAVAAP